MTDSQYNHFTVEELSCHCGDCELGPDDMNEKFMRKVVAMREEAGFPFNVTSSIRCVKYNRLISKSGDNSAHPTGHGLDVAVSLGRAYRFIELAIKHGMTGIGVKQKGKGRFIHIDDLGKDYKGSRPTVWSY